MKDMTYAAQMTREARLRRALDRCGLALRKSRSRTPEHLHYGLYHIVDPYRSVIVEGGDLADYSMNLDDVEAFLKDR